jgi:predicted acyl esterase
MRRVIPPSKRPPNPSFRCIFWCHFQWYSQDRRASNFIHIDCWNTSQVFKAGHRIGLEIASSAFPKYDRNLNTGAPLGVTTEMAVAEQHIYHDVEHPSAVVMPIVPQGVN